METTFIEKRDTENEDNLHVYLSQLDALQR